MIESIICNTSSMGQTIQLKTEFFELIRLLNQSNLNANQKTDVLFFIETAKDKSVLYATTNKTYRIQLIFENKIYGWKPCGFSGLPRLEEKLCDAFNARIFENTHKSDLTKKIRSLVFQNFS